MKKLKHNAKACNSQGKLVKLPEDTEAGDKKRFVNYFVYSCL